MRKGHSWHALIGMALALLVLACQSAMAAPQRVVSVFLCTDEYVFRLLPRSRIAALSVLAGDTHPTVSTIAGKVKGITLVRPNAEAVLGVHPDLVVMYKGTNPRLKAHLVEAGVKVLDVPWANSLAGVRKVTHMLGKALGAQTRAKAMLAAMDAKLAAARAEAPHPPVSALIYEPNGYTASDAVTDAVMRAGGLVNAVGSMGTNRLGRASVEQVLAAAPQLVILNAAREGGPALADTAIRNPALAALKGRSLIVQATLRPLLCPGPWSADAAGEFARMARKAARLAKPKSTH